MSPKQREYNIPSGLGVWKKHLIELFPEEQKAIETYFSMVNRVNRQMKGWVLVKVLPIWLVKLISMFGLSRFLSDFYSWDGSTLNDIIEVNLHPKSYYFKF
jgi:all-trans-retinol 13,14-reductase